MIKEKRKNDINVEGSTEMKKSGRWKSKRGRNIEEVVERWNGKGERKVGEV